MTKVCICCGAEKSLDDFYGHPQMSDGRLNKCKPCVRLAVKLNRIARSEQYREYERVRNQTPERKLAVKSFAFDVTKRAARSAVGNAVRDGRLEKLPCEVCGGKSEAHHDDYSKPLDVRWLCFEHHRLLHYSMAA